MTRSKSTPPLYEIKIKGHLDETLKGWFDGFVITSLESGETRLLGLLADQSALQGLLNRISRLGLSLISVNAVDDPGAAQESGKDDD